MYKLNKEELFNTLKSSETGLTKLEAENRLKVNGKNELKKEKRPSFIKLFLKQFANIMVAILLISSAVSISIAIANKEFADLFEGFVILFIVIMNALIGVFQENKAQACLDELKKYDKISVKVLRNKTWQNIDSSELVIGDIVEMEAGNIVPADIRLLSTNNFACNESGLTGESEPCEKDANANFINNAPLAERKNMAYSSSLVVSGKATGIIVSTGINTEIGKIANLLKSSKKEITPLQKSINKIGKIITYVVLAVCLIILSVELISGNSIVDALMVSVALAVAAIPESLPAVITIIMALGVQQLAKRKCIIKHLHAVETLGSCEIICTDKTGTLTENKMKVVKTYSLTDSQDLFKCMSWCNSAKISGSTIVGEPTEQALLEHTRQKISTFKKPLYEIPFNSSRKMMSVVVDDNGLISYTKGAPDILLGKCSFVKIENEIKPLTAELKTKIQNIQNEMSDNALRVIGFCCKCNVSIDKDIERDMIFLGLAGLMDKPKPEVKKSVENCFKAGLKPVMITGDHKRTAFAIAKELNIATSLAQVITGEELDLLSDKELAKQCMQFSVYARVTPEHKVRIVKAFKNLKKIVAMTGDGVNDAPSLKIADIGVGMGKSGTDVVKSVADMLITDDNFSSIVIAVEEGRKVYNNIQKALQFLISTNCVEVFGMLIALLFFPKYTFLLPSQMLFINLVTDSLPAFALGMEKVEKEVMLSPPRNPQSGLFGGSVGKAIIYQSILQTAIALSVFLIGVYCYNPNIASTMVFFTIIFMQLLHSLNCKTNNSLFSKKLWDNKTFNICFLITFALNIIVACVPFMYTLFNLEFLNFSQWIVVIIASILIIPTCELFKIILQPSEKYLKINKKQTKMRKI